MAQRFTCARCKRTFSMAAHLARHKAAMHGAKSKKKTKAPRAQAAPKGRRGRPTAMASRLSGLSLDELVRLADEAHAMARSRLAALQRSI